MSHIIVLGAGPLGRAATAALLDRGDAVTVATRSGTVLPGAAAIQADVTDSESMASLPKFDAIVACVNFPYGQWQQNWPPAIDNLIALAERLDAPLVIAGNLYSYGPSATAFKETDDMRATYRNGQIRADVWRKALAAHHAGRIRATEIRGSDYVGPNTGMSAHGGDRLLGPATTGKTAFIIGDPDQPHAWTATRDFGAMLARATTQEQMWGRPWHVPSAPPLTIRELSTLAAKLAGNDAPPRILSMPRPLLRVLAPFNSAMSAILDASYQFDYPFRVDDTDARTLLGMTHTPIETTVAEAVRAMQAPEPASSTR
ncbi:NAD-dependent epimerase/dehydratase family protein [Gulosibacter molinativorax]|uniref:NADP oxidoreductase n=1 Tax=Gulosibacter molinativorax TaxID=256821 RepID=A0ABT7CBN8_9MICO|nr:NAD-dependent epimerase/dehydratase family protein [Gulosibacter molinativorax]MDJ1372555.1 NADP oxidoreductase [Gulosibacter molinativorax]QUY62618.1 Hypothetical protein GMOLON4_1923 [Gulosibacter molinativorax]